VIGSRRLRISTSTARASRSQYRAEHRGLQLHIEHHRTPLTAIALSVRAGARFDGDHPGLAHFTEHMLFQGTDRLSAEELNCLAAELGGQHNAVTRYETITLTFECLNQDVERAVALLADQYYNTRADAERVRVERSVVLDEIRGYQSDPVHALEEEALCKFFGGGISHPVTGTASSIKSLTPEQVRAFIDRHFVHPATAIAVIGGAKVDRVARAIEQSFHATPKPAPPPPRVWAGRSGILRRQNRGSEGFVHLLLEAPASPSDFLASALALEILGDLPDTRLFREIRGRLGLGYMLETGSSWGPDWAVLIIGASCPSRHVPRLQEAIERVCEEAATGGFSADEVARARKKLRLNYTLLNDSLIDRAVALAEDTVLGFPLPEEACDLLNAISCETASAAWRRVWNGRRLFALLT